MAAWRMKEAGDTWETVCERAYSGVPQYLTRDGVSYQVVISLVQSPPATSGKPTVLEALTSCPCDISSLVQATPQEELSSFDRAGGFQE